MQKYQHESDQGGEIETLFKNRYMKVRTVLWHLSYNNGLITLLILYVTKGQTWDDCQNVFPLISKRESFTKNQPCAVHHVFLHFRWITADVLKNYYDKPRVLKWINNQKNKKLYDGALWQREQKITHQKGSSKGHQNIGQ